MVWTSRLGFEKAKGGGSEENGQRDLAGACFESFPEHYRWRVWCVRCWSRGEVVLENNRGEVVLEE